MRSAVLNLAILILAIRLPAGALETEHWAFQRIVRPTTGNSIDKFISREHAKRMLKPQTAADPAHLLRRLHLNLTGLAPTPEQTRDFVKNPSPENYLSIVNQQLNSPRHGERWGRHWMDVWRYSDWYGLGKQLRVSQKHLWRWRDWIIKSLNDDKGYDRMIQEMLAGDELDPANPDVVVGTGFLARNYYLFNRTTWLDNTIEHTAKAFLGITMNCVKCHEHKYDPISAEKYYQFRAIFEPHQIRLDAVPGESDFEKDGLPRAFDDHPNAKTYVHLKGDSKSLDKSKIIEPDVPFAFADVPFIVTPVDLPASAFAPGTRNYFQSNALATARRKVAAARSALSKAEKAVENFSEPPKRSAPKKQLAIKEDFESPNPKLWRPLGKDWKFENGSLVRHTAGRSDNLRSQFQHPRDFEAVFEYTTTGGATYKSLGIRFDSSRNDQDYNMVYTSAHGPGPKLQAAYKRDGKTAYPSTGRIGRKIKIGHRYQLRILVKGHLLNVYLDGDFQLAFSLPHRSTERFLELTSFDATSEFHSLEIRELSVDAELVKSGASTPAPNPKTLPQLKVAAELTRLDLRRLELNHASLAARIAADNARVHDKPDRKARAESAARAEWKAKLNENEFLLRQEQAKKNPDSKNVSKLRSAINSARKKLKAPGSDYTSLSGSRKALETPAHKFGQYDEIYQRISTGRRLALARWITHPNNPLTARVAVNHIWMRHFGTPLVDQVSDFGTRAKKPIHHDLLDWLAAELIDNDWSMKHIHQLIVVSDAWQRSSSTLKADPETLQADPENRFYWRMNTRRMESQLVRDNLLHLSGKLAAKLGGPSLSANASSNRRSIYFRHGRDDAQKFLSMFDDADFLQCYRRAESIVPQQALALSNSKASLGNAATIAGNITTKDNTRFINEAFQTILSRQPDHYEIAECEAFLRDIAKLENSDRRTRLVHALLNHNDFVTIR